MCVLQRNGSAASDLVRKQYSTVGLLSCAVLTAASNRMRRHDCDRAAHATSVRHPLERGRHRASARRRRRRLLGLLLLVRPVDPPLRSAPLHTSRVPFSLFVL